MCVRTNNITFFLTYHYFILRYAMSKLHLIQLNTSGIGFALMKASSSLVYGV